VVAISFTAIFVLVKYNGGAVPAFYSNFRSREI